MKDFKTYSSGRRNTGRKLLKIILLVVFALVAAGLYLFIFERPVINETVQPQPPSQAPNQDQQDPDRITVPLALPGQSQEESSRVSNQRTDQRISTTPHEPSNNETEQQPATISPSPPELNPAPTLTNATETISHVIAPGDTLSTIFDEMGLSATLLHQIIHSSKTAKSLTDIRPGEILRVELDQKKNLQSLILERDKVHSLHIQAVDSGFSSSKLTKELEKRTAHAQGLIENSLYISAKQAGLPETTIMELAEIFGWDIDFALEIRSGDSFTVIYEEEFLDGEKIRTGPILAAEFINQGRIYRAVRYIDKTGKADYYTPDGQSMRKAFLRAPVDFRRISSRFTTERWHPVLGKKRPHRGVDYAANTGTPIKAAGDGKIIHRSRKGGYGRTVIIQHAHGYSTLYAHLSSYARQARLGSQIKQGQIIGYVGQSGLATGPHLHYEFRVNGVHRNPLTVKLPDAEPIAKKFRADFLLQTQPLVTQLDTLNRMLVADAR
jgi:murein DD-endopeptidase MepM/ murein hydrolase activator NlpD